MYGCLQPELVPFSGASALISTNPHPTGMSHSMHASLCRRLSHPILRNTSRYITSIFSPGVVPGSVPVSARDAPPNFRPISPLISQANLARLQQTCHLDGEVGLNTSRNNKPPAPSVGSAFSTGLMLVDHDLEVPAQHFSLNYPQYGPSRSPLLNPSSHVI
jgi:hypothetical protein